MGKTKHFSEVSQLPLITNQNISSFKTYLVSGQAQWPAFWQFPTRYAGWPGSLALLQRLMSLLSWELGNLRSKLVWELGSLKSWNPRKSGHQRFHSHKDRGPNGLSRDLFGASWEETKQSEWGGIQATQTQTRTLMWAIVLNGSLGYKTFWKPHVFPCFKRNIVNFED